MQNISVIEILPFYDPNMRKVYVFNSRAFVFFMWVMGDKYHYNKKWILV